MVDILSRFAGAKRRPAPPRTRRPAARLARVAEAYVYTDPACPWSWAAEPALRAMEAEFGDGLEVRFVMGGLARLSQRPALDHPDDAQPPRPDADEVALSRRRGACRRSPVRRRCAGARRPTAGRRADVMPEDVDVAL